MQDLRPDQFADTPVVERAERTDAVRCQFVDAGDLDPAELRVLGTLLRKNSVTEVTIGTDDPVRWAMDMQEYQSRHSRQLGDHPHRIVVLENARRVARDRTVRSEGEHLGFIVRADCNPAAVYELPER